LKEKRFKTQIVIVREVIFSLSIH